MLVKGKDPILILTQNSTTAEELCEELERSRLSPWFLRTDLVDLSKPRNHTIPEKLPHSELVPYLEAWDEGREHLKLFTAEQSLHRRASLIFNIEDGDRLTVKHPATSDPNAYCYGALDVLDYSFEERGYEPNYETTTAANIPTTDQPVRFLSLTTEPNDPQMIDLLADALHYLTHNPQILSYIWALENGVITKPFNPKGIQ